MALAYHKVQYYSVSNYLFSAVTKRMNSYLSKTSEISEKEEFHLNWLLVDLDVLFFIHSMDIRIRPTDRLARLIYDLLEKTSNWSTSHKEIIHKKIFDHIRQVINIFINHASDMRGLETLNLLTISSMLPANYELPESSLLEYLGNLGKYSETNDFYFRWITFMLYIKDNSAYSELRDTLIREADQYFLESDDMFTDSEYFMFYFDYLACPYIGESMRRRVMDKVKEITLDRNQNAVRFNVNKQSEIVLNHDFIVSWRDPEYLKSSLNKKEYIFPYS